MIDISSHSIDFSTNGNTHIIDITKKVQEAIKESGIKEGNVTLFAIGSTTGLSTVEFEPGLVETDVAAMYQKIAAYGVPYQHNKTWGDDNGAAHLRSTLTGSSLVIPVIGHMLTLGTWQQIIFIDFDTRPRSRKVIAQVIGKK